MGWDYANYFEEMMTLENAGLLHIFIAEEGKSNADCTWFYRLVGDNEGQEYLITEESGKATLCGCEECNCFGTELFEYFSAYLALKWIKDKAPDISILLWVCSKKFLFDISEALFGYADKYRCAFLRTLDKDLGHLLSELDVEVLEYSYANKDMIPVFFK
jgi:hypothetical protein